VPALSPWPALLDWLVERALATYAPGALRRARATARLDEDLQTAAELEARRALEELEAR
jgi:hypothetical protein